jgi:DNA-binding GntR family transcriptional regulator
MQEQPLSDFVVSASGMEESGDVFPVPRSRHLRDYVVSYLRRQISTKRIPPGTRLDSKAIAGQFEVSTGPVREALIMLASEGLVESRAGRGFFVRRFLIEDLAEIYEMREILDLAAAEKAIAVATDLEISRVVAAFREFDASREGDRADILEKDLAFHEAIAVACGNSLLVSAQRGLHAQCATLLLPLTETSEIFMGVPREVHAQMAEGIAARDMAATKDSIRRHYGHARRALLNRLSQTSRD